MKRAVLLLLPLAAVSAGALEPPSTAQSQATTVPVALLDDDANALRFPSLSVGLEPSVLAYGATGDGRVDAGVRLDGGGGNVWYQTVHRRADIASRTNLRFGSAHSQAGWARKLGPLRIGAAFTWSTDANRSRRFEAGDFADRRSEYYETRFEAVDIRDGAIGIGWTGRVSVDAVVDFTQESLRNELITRSFRLIPGESRSSRRTIRNTVDTGLRLGGALRLLVPVGRDLRLRLLASACDTGHRFDYSDVAQLVRDGSLDADSRREKSFRNRGSEFAAGVRLENGTARNDRSWSVYAWYQRIRSAWRYELRGSSGRRDQDRTDEAIAGFSLRHPGPKGVEFLGGIAIEGTWRRHRAQFYFLDDDYLRDDADESERLDYRFAWGAHRAFDRIDLTASVGSTVPPLDPIASLDIRVPF